MSEDSKDLEAVDSAAEEDLVAEPPAEEPDTGPERDARPRKNGASVSWLALFLSFVTLAAVGYMIMEDRRARASAESSSDSIEQLEGRVNASRDSLADLNQDLADLASSDEATRSQVESLQRGIEDRLELLDSLPSRMSSLESSMASLQGVSAGARDARAGTHAGSDRAPGGGGGDTSRGVGGRRLHGRRWRDELGGP